MSDDIRQGLEKVLRSIHPFPVPTPGGGFAPLEAANRQLAAYGLPERPNEMEEPEYYEFWNSMLGAPTEIVGPEFLTADEMVPNLLAAAHVSAFERIGRERQSVRRFNHRKNSRNWSGAAITPLLRPNRFERVTGSWKVPRADPPSVSPSGAASEYRSSTWIGVGGQRSYNSLPQIGTHQFVEVVDGVPRQKYEAWWQWWIKDRPGHNIPIVISNFDVAEGDEILASMTVEAPSPGDVRFNLKNRRTGRLVAFKVRAPANIVELGATAEWVHERPTKNNAMYPLPHCTDVEFRHCLAWSAPDFGAVQVPQKLEKNVRLIRMHETFDQPFRSALISVPEKQGPTRLRVRYREPGT